MGLLTRYIIIELLKVFLVALTGMSTLMLLVFLIYEAIRQGLTASAAIQLIPYMICLLYTSDAADEGLGVDLGGRRMI